MQYKPLMLNPEYMVLECDNCDMMLFIVCNVLLYIVIIMSQLIILGINYSVTWLWQLWQDLS